MALPNSNSLIHYRFCFTTCLLWPSPQKSGECHWVGRASCFTASREFADHEWHSLWCFWAWKLKAWSCHLAELEILPICYRCKFQHSNMEDFTSTVFSVCIVAFLLTSCSRFESFCVCCEGRQTFADRKTSCWITPLFYGIVSVCVFCLLVR